MPSQRYTPTRSAGPAGAAFEFITHTAVRTTPSRTIRGIYSLLYTRQQKEGRRTTSAVGAESCAAKIMHESDNRGGLKRSWRKATVFRPEVSVRRPEPRRFCRAC